MTKDIMLFTRKLFSRVLHSNKHLDTTPEEPWKGARTQDLRNVKMLFELLNENPIDETDELDPV